ncbi:MAG: alpha-amylase family protein, partial [Bacteroidales bacterium]
MNDKFIIYQLLLRVFGNTNDKCISNGSFQLNTSGKFSSITLPILQKIRELNVTHVWYTGIIEHATKTDFTKYGIKKDNPAIVKGEAGSPYAIKDYYDVNPYLADNISNRMAEFESLLERTHKSGLKVIIDFVPNHLARCYNSDSLPVGIENFGATDNPYNTIKGGSFGFNPNNNFYYLPDSKLNLSPNYIEFPAKVTGNDCFTASPTINDWYETIKLNYGIDYCGGAKKYFNPIPKTWSMMLQILQFWSAKGIDGFRCDMAEMVPVEFWKWAIDELKKEYPKILFIAEVYNPMLYNSYLQYGGFDYLYDKVGLYDNLKAITKGYAAASSITGNWQALGDMQNSMLNFLENHDEQRIASDFNIGNPFKAIPQLVVSLMLNRAPFMLYFGQEFGEKGMLQEGFSGIDGRTSIFDYCSAPSTVRFLSSLITPSKTKLLPQENELYKIYTKLFSIAMGEKAIKNGDTYDLEYANLNNSLFNSATQFVFARRTRKSITNITAPDELIIIAVDFSIVYNNSGSFSSINNHLQISVNLPKHFFNFWNIISGKQYKCVDLLDNTSYSTILTSDSIFNIKICHYGVGIVKIV